MAYAGKLPSVAAVKRAARDDLTQAPRNAAEFAAYILHKALMIEEGRTDDGSVEVSLRPSRSSALRCH